MQTLNDQEYIEKYYTFMKYYYRWVNQNLNYTSGNTFVGLYYIVFDVTPGSVIDQHNDILKELTKDEIIQPHNQLLDLWAITDRAKEAFDSLCQL